MTQPTPSGGSVVSNAWTGVRSLDTRWLIAIVVVGGVLAWYLLKDNVDSSDTDNSSNGGPKGDGSSYNTETNDWASKAKALLLSQGYSQSDVNSALKHYLRGGQMTPEDTTLIGIAVSRLGIPGVGSGSDPSYAVSSPNTNPGPGAPQAGVSNGYNSGVGNATNEQDVNSATNSQTGQTYWLVPSLGFGPTATYRGLAATYYGDSNLAPSIQAANPNGPNTVYGQIPPGTITKVPRTVNTQ